MLRNHDLNLLPIFDALMQEQHLSRAAERLHMSQPAVSNALKRLRNAYEDDLFVRTGRGLAPTQRAIELHAVVAPALGSIRKSFDDRVFSPDDISRTIDISMNPAVEHIWSPVLMQEVRARAPNLKLKIHPDYVSDIPGRLKDGRLSYAVEYTTMPDDHFESELLVREALSLVCAADHPTIGRGLSLEQFQMLPQVSLVRRSELVRTQNSRRTTPLEFLLGDALPVRNIVLQVSSFVTIPAIVAAIDLIAVMPDRLVRPWAETGQLKCLALPFDCPNIEIRLFWHKSRSNDPGHDWLIELLTGTAGQI